VVPKCTYYTRTVAGKRRRRTTISSLSPPPLFERQSVIICTYNTAVYRGGRYILYVNVCMYNSRLARNIQFGITVNGTFSLSLSLSLSVSAIADRLYTRVHVKSECHLNNARPILSPSATHIYTRTYIDLPV